jgi:metal-responsive CopG/Arc/MetJ family transcriptional regulator
MIYTMNRTSMSVSIDPSLAEYIKTYQKQHKVATKSEVIEHAIKALRRAELVEEYKAAMREWSSNKAEAELWDKTVADGLDLNETW